MWGRRGRFLTVGMLAAAALGLAVAAAAVEGAACAGPGACGDGEHCLRPPGACTAGGGTCRRRDVVCPLIVDPVCGCDARSYISPCEAERRGVSIARFGSCCVGACRALDRVTIADLTYGVALGLGTLRGVCRSFDGDGNGRVTIDELTTAVRHAMYGCPPGP